MDFVGNVLPGNLERYLRGIDFPIEKQELLDDGRAFHPKISGFDGSRR